MNSPLPASPAPAATPLDRNGLLAAATAFTIWGLLPLYLKQMPTVPALQITAHRLVWGCIFALIWLAVRRELPLIGRALKDPQTLWRLCVSACLISFNWLIYVWGIANGRVVETSLGYFINPLVIVLLSVVVLSERLNGAQWLAVGVAAAGVGYLTWSTGQLPWISLCLALTFGIYGLVRKTIKVDALAGFAAETLLVLPVGLAYLLWCEFNGTGSLAHASTGTSVLLVFGGPITAIPLVLFALGARRLPYSTVGLLQYIGPTLQLMLGVFLYHEPFGGPRVIGFVTIWMALAIYAIDGLWRSRKLAALR